MSCKKWSDAITTCSEISMTTTLPGRREGRLAVLHCGSCASEGGFGTPLLSRNAFLLKNSRKCDIISKGSLLDIDRFPCCRAQLNSGGLCEDRRGLCEDGGGRGASRY